jgi:phenylpropionate dioxygenase-like ring-hydroxylating dioxygenase large terminal subunit
MTELKKIDPGTSSISDDPVIIPVEAYISADYARQEARKLWRRVWQVACREEEIPEIGDFYTYDIAEESIIIARVGPGAADIAAYHNVCPHRGRRLTSGCGKTKRFFCRYHGWQWNLDGRNHKVVDREDWGGVLSEEFLRLPQVKLARWAGFVFVNLDPNSEPLESFLGNVPYWLDPFEIGKMRYKWRQWLHFPCNWKVALEAFIEGYHVGTSHPQILRWSDGHTWSRAEGLHSCFGNAARMTKIWGEQAELTFPPRSGRDARQEITAFMENMNETVGLGTLTTQTFIDAARKLKDVLPENVSGADASKTMMELARQMDAARGVEWPTIDPVHYAQSGTDWHIFPNTIFLHGMTYLLGYRARPHGIDPDSCIFEVYALERFPEGQEPKPENLHQPDISKESWQLVLCQDFQNMPEVQKGMKSSAFRGCVPSPLQEKPVINFHHNLAEFMGSGEPQPFPKTII